MHPVAEVELVNIKLCTFGVEVHLAVTSKQLHFYRRVGHLVDDSLAVKQHLVINTQHGVQLTVFGHCVNPVDAAENGSVLGAQHRQLNVVGIAARLVEIDVLTREFDGYILTQHSWFVVKEKFNHRFLVL